MIPYRIEKKHLIYHFFREFQAIIGDSAILQQYACREKAVIIKLVGESVKLYGNALGVQKNSVYYTKLKTQIREYKNNGFLQRLEKKWLQTKCFENHSTIQPASSTSLGGAFSVLLVGIAVSIIIFAIEKHYDRALKILYSGQ